LDKTCDENDMLTDVVLISNNDISERPDRKLEGITLHRLEV
jgi:hypothetical protein